MQDLMPIECDGCAGGHTQSLQAAIADEIREVRLHVERLAEILVSDQHFALNFVDQLQVFDMIVQHIEESACLLDRMSRGAEPRAALASIRLEGLRARLDRALDRSHERTG